MVKTTQSQTLLESRRCDIVNRVRNVADLVDYMIANKVFSSEIKNKVLNKGTRQDQLRELLGNLNSSRHSNLMLKWLKENEADLMEELGYVPTNEEPQRKRLKIQEEGVDETDSQVTETFDLKNFSTFARLEEFVSATKTEELISNLKHKLTTDEMNDLEKKLKNKKLKKSLCLNAEDVKKIISNQKLKLFLDSSKNAAFPDLAIQLFFDNNTSCVSASNFMMEKDMDSCTEDHEMGDKSAESGYASYCNSSSNGNPSEHLASQKHNMDIELPGSEPVVQDGGSYVREQREGLHPACSKIEQGTETSAPLEGIREKSMKSESPQDTQEKSESHSLTHFDMTQNEESDIKKQGHLENDPSHLLQTEDQNDTPLEKPLNVQETVGEESIQLDTQVVTDALTTQEDIEIGFNASVECSTPLNGTKQIVKSQKRQLQNKRKLGKINNEKKLLSNWANKQCRNEKELNDLFDCISIRNKVEHKDYPFFVAETIIVYTNPQSKEKQIIFITDGEKQLKEKILSKATRNLINYQMWVCDIKKTIVIQKVKDKEKENVIDYESFDFQTCLKLISEAFLPAFAVFKKLQRESKLYSLISQG